MNGNVKTVTIKLDSSVALCWLILKKNNNLIQNCIQRTLTKIYTVMNVCLLLEFVILSEILTMKILCHKEFIFFQIDQDHDKT